MQEQGSDRLVVREAIGEEDRVTIMDAISRQQKSCDYGYSATKAAMTVEIVMGDGLARIAWRGERLVWTYGLIWREMDFDAKPRLVSAWMIDLSEDDDEARALVEDAAKIGGNEHAMVILQQPCAGLLAEQTILFHRFEGASP